VTQPAVTGQYCMSVLSDETFETTSRDLQLIAGIGKDGAAQPTHIVAPKRAPPQSNIDRGDRKRPTLAP